MTPSGIGFLPAVVTMLHIVDAGSVDAEALIARFASRV